MAVLLHRKRAPAKASDWRCCSPGEISADEKRVRLQLILNIRLLGVPLFLTRPSRQLPGTLQETHSDWPSGGVKIRDALTRPPRTD